MLHAAFQKFEQSEEELEIEGLLRILFIVCYQERGFEFLAS